MILPDSTFACIATANIEATEAFTDMITEAQENDGRPTEKALKRVAILLKNQYEIIKIVTQENENLQFVAKKGRG